VRLRDKGELGASEADLLLAERRLVETDILRNPPTDSRVKCYDMMMLPAGTMSLERVEARLVALEGIAKAGKVRPEVVARVRERLASDLATLRDSVARTKKGETPFQEKAEAKRSGEVLSRAEAAAKALGGKWAGVRAALGPRR
jgi:hypothetical protein